MTTNPRFLDYEGQIYIRVERKGQLPAYSGRAVKVGIMGKEPEPFIFNAQSLTISAAQISNTIQSDKFEAGVQGWRLNAETGAIEIYGPHRD